MSDTQIEPFAIKDCALSAIATGRRAQNLRELRDGLQAVEPGSIYYHFWGQLLRPGFEDPEYNNDFASWVRHQLHDTRLAERLGVLDPAHFSNEELRQEVIDIIENRLDETEFLSWSLRDHQFHFVRAQTVVFDTRRRISHPRELALVTPSLSVGSIYYHVVDARRRAPKSVDDFRTWLMNFGDRYADLNGLLAEIDPYFITLIELRDRLSALFTGYFKEAGK